MTDQKIEPSSYLPEFFPEYNPDRDGITQGLLQMWLACREKARLFLYGLDRPRRVFIFGTILHTALEIVYNAHKISSGISIPIDPSLIEGAVDTAGEIWIQDNPGYTESDLKELEFSIATLCGILPVYFNHWRSDFELKRWICLEEEFSVDFYGSLLRGKVDGAFSEKGNSNIFLFETKGLSRIVESSLLDRLSLDFQTNFYVTAIAKMYESKVGGVTYNIIRNPQNQIKSGENLRRFSERMKSYALADPDYYFFRYEVSLLETEQVRFSESLRRILSEFKAWWMSLSGQTHPDHTPSSLIHFRNTNSCEDRYGTCQFLPICANGDLSKFRVRDKLYPELST